ncbi:MAG TPA: magnesium/cobalt transporter CorA [Actinomycetes bacterium]|jgi:magnesium transporter|nr:magnesium/cobalt transporter CorA [Actinomycetes bacterium]
MIIDCAVYQEGRRRPGELALADAFEATEDDNTFVWIGLYEPDEREFDSVAREFNLHELAVEDAIKAHQRPKLEVYEDTLFVVLKTARYLEADETVEFGEIMLFIGPQFVVAVRHKPASELRGVRKEIESRPDLLRFGPGAVLYAILDRVVDDYLPVIEGLDQDIKEVEKQVFSEGGHNPAERIYMLKREVIEFHQSTAPLAEPLDRLVRGQVPLLHQEMPEYFRDVQDHLIRVVDQVNGFRDLLTSVLQANLTQVALRQNEVGMRQNADMRKISAWVAIVAVPTMLAGIYGMNFDHMPELRWVFGYPLALLAMALACAALYRAFKRNGWL